MRVPVYDNLQTGIAPTNGAQVRNQDVGAIGEIGARQAVQMGQLLGNAGDMLGQIALQRQALVNEADVKQADIAANRAVRDLLRNPQTGFLNQTGAAAVKSRDDVVRQIDEIYQKAGEGLGNDTARSMWGNVSQRRRDDAFSLIDDHAGKEEYVYAIQSSEDRMQSETDALLHSLNDPNAYAQHLATIRVESAHSAALQRMDPALKLKKDLAQAHMAVIRDRIAAGEPTVAQTYYDSHKDEISESDRAAFEAPLKQAVNASLAFTHADQATGLFGPKTAYGGFDKAAIDGWARKLYGSDIDGLNLFRQEMDRRIQDEAISQQTRLTNAQGVIYERVMSEGLTAARQTPEWFDLPLQARDDIVRNASALQAQRKGLASRDPQTRWASEAQAMSAAGNLRDGDLTHMSDGEMRAHFGGVPRALELVQYRKANLGKPPLVPEIVLDSLLASIGIAVAGESAADIATAGFGRMQLQSAVLGEQARLGRPLSPAETGEVLRNNLLTAMGPPAPDVPTSAALRGVSRIERDQVRAELDRQFQRTGDPALAPTEDNIARTIAARRASLTGTLRKNGQ